MSTTQLTMCLFRIIVCSTVGVRGVHVCPLYLGNILYLVSRIVYRRCKGASTLRHDQLWWHDKRQNLRFYYEIIQSASNNAGLMLALTDVKQISVNTHC